MVPTLKSLRWFRIAFYLHSWTSFHLISLWQSQYFILRTHCSCITCFLADMSEVMDDETWWQLFFRLWIAYVIFFHKRLLFRRLDLLFFLDISLKLFFHTYYVTELFYFLKISSVGSRLNFNQLISTELNSEAYITSIHNTPISSLHYSGRQLPEICWKFCNNSWKQQWYNNFIKFHGILVGSTIAYCCDHTMNSCVQTLLRRQYEYVWYIVTMLLYSDFFLC